MSNGFTETRKIASFGANSSGKTLQIRYLIDAFGPANVGIVSCEHGVGTIESDIRKSGVEMKEPKNLREFKEAWKWASDNYSDKNKWVCVDGGTRAIQWGANEIIQGTDAAFIEMAMGKEKHEVSEPLRQYLRFISNEGNIDGRKLWPSIAWDTDFEMTRWVGIPCNHYWTFWEDETWKNEKKGAPWQIDAPGEGSRKAIYGTFDFILRLTRGGREGEIVIATHDPTGRFVKSKTRDDWNWAKVPLEQQNFNLAKFIETLRPQTAAVEAIP
jgi:hypothetical protein